MAAGHSYLPSGRVWIVWVCVCVAILGPTGVLDHPARSVHGGLVAAQPFNFLPRAGWCVGYGTCENTTKLVNGKLIGDTTCLNYTEAVKPDFDIVSFCGPTFADKVCCDKAGFERITKNFGQARDLLSPCPACFTSFKNLWCQYTCGPDQSLFVQPLEVTTSSYNKTVINRTRFLIDPRYAEKLYLSCRDVSFFGQKIVQVLFGLDPLAFIRKMADREDKNGFSPTQIDVVYSSGNALNSQDSLFSCDTTDNSLRCSCTHCNAVCPAADTSESSSDTDWQRLLVVALLGVFVGAVAMAALRLHYLASKGRLPERSLTVPSAPPQEEEEANPAPKNRRATLLAAKMEDLSSFQKQVYKVVVWESKHAGLVLLAGIFVVIAFSPGLTKWEIETDPVDLWVPSGSQVLGQKKTFDAAFGPFFRTEQVIITGKGALKDQPVLSRSLLRQLDTLQGEVANLTATYGGTTYRLDSLCYKPLSGQGCLVSSPTQWFVQQPPARQLHSSALTEADVRQVVNFCSFSTVDTVCLGSIGAPTFPYVALGGYNAKQYTNATAVVVVFLLNNFQESDARIEAPRAWESQFISYMQNSATVAALSNDYEVVFAAERSVQDELERDADGDTTVVVASYVIMFVYMSLALSTLFKWPNPFDCSGLFLRTRFALGLCSVLMVAGELVVAISILSAAGVKATLIISAVVPFVILAIGVDNILLISFTYQSMDGVLSIEERLGLAFAESSTALVLTALCEAFTFYLSVLADMPAVSAFSIFAGTAIVVDFFMLFTVYVAIFTFDERRRQRRVADCLLCCSCFAAQRTGNADLEMNQILAAKLSAGDDKEALATADDPAQAAGDDKEALATADDPAQAAGDHSQQADANNDSAQTASNDGAGAGVDEPTEADDGDVTLTKRVFARYYGPALLHPVGKVLVVVVALAIALTSLFVWSTEVEMGLDARVAVPDDSYLQGYFSQLGSQLKTGPPVYFVVGSNKVNGSGVSLANPAYPDNANKICGFFGCENTSLVNQLAALVTDDATPTSYITGNAFSWLDDYLLWLRSNSRCCRYKTPFANSTKVFCPPEDTDAACQRCLTPGIEVASPEQFTEFLPWFWDTSCSDLCTVCGSGKRPDVHLSSSNEVKLARYWTYHTVLKTQQDYINALKAARRIAKDLSASTGLDVFPYSIFYVFYEQYLTIETVAMESVLLAFLAIFLMCLALIRDISTSLAVVCTIAMVIVDLVGVMGLWDISLNAISVVNITVAVGISVPFCIHLAVATSRQRHGSGDAKVLHALVEVGSPVYRGFESGVVGVIVLSAASSQVFVIYYFRMYLAIFLLSCFHGLAFLPVVLSVIQSTLATKPSRTQA